MPLPRSITAPPRSQTGGGRLSAAALARVTPHVERFGTPWAAENSSPASSASSRSGRDTDGRLGGHHLKDARLAVVAGACAGRYASRSRPPTTAPMIRCPSSCMQRSTSGPAGAWQPSRALDEATIVRPTSRARAQSVGQAAVSRQGIVGAPDLAKQAGVSSWNGRETRWPSGPGKADAEQLPDRRGGTGQSRAGSKSSANSHPNGGQSLGKGGPAVLCASLSMMRRKSACPTLARHSRLRPREMDDFAPVFKSKLWKLNADGDRMQDSHWLLREIWISRIGNLVYWSSKHECELVLYSANDLRKAKVVSIPKPLICSGCKRWAFRISLPSSDGLGFIPGELATESREERTRWLAMLGALDCD